MDERQASDYNNQVDRLARFLKWAMIAVGAFSLPDIIAGVSSQSTVRTLYGINTLVQGLIFALARWRLVRTRSLATPILIVCFALAAGGVVSTLLAPVLLPVTALFPVLTVMVALPYSSKPFVRTLLVVMVAVELVIVLIGLFVKLFPPFPESTTTILSGTPVMVAFIFLLVWHYFARLQESLTLAQHEAIIAKAARHEAEQATAQVQQQQQELQARQSQLQQAVDDYLAFVQQIGRGQLDDRMGVAHAGALGQLGQGLNTMAESLQSAKREAEELRQQDLQAKATLEQAVAEYLRFTEAIAGGDLSQRITGRSEGLLGKLSAGLNHMAESLQHVTREVQDAADKILSAAAEILSATTQQSAGAAQQSASITQTTTTIEEIKSIAQQTAQQAAQVAADSQGALQIARRGTSSVEETLGGMSQIKVRVEGIAETILLLAEQTQAIGAIIQTVGELADQSNLLALNAAIEAARAGEQGKSFAVVAQHVRDLAERSKGATSQIREILGEIQDSTNRAVLVTEEGTKGVEVGTRLAAQTGQVIHRIAEEVESGAQANVQMAAAAQQQTAGIEQIGQAMQAIQQATTQTLASTRQAERAARDLNTLAQALKQTITMYRLS